jgi:hypothetical protein
MYKICRIFALIVFIAASLKFTAHSLNFLRAKYKMDTQKYINPEDNADFVDNKELRKKAKLYRQKMSIHTSIAEQIVSQKLKKNGR